MSWYTITAAMRTATVVPAIESTRGPLAREPMVDRIIYDTALNAMIAASTPRVRVRAPALPVRSK